MTELHLTKSEYAFLKCLNEAKDGRATFESIMRHCNLDREKCNDLLSNFQSADPPIVEKKGYVKTADHTKTACFSLTFEGRQVFKKIDEKKNKEKMGFLESNFDFIKDHWKENHHKVVWWVVKVIWSICLIAVGIYLKTTFS